MIYIDDIYNFLNLKFIFFIFFQNKCENFIKQIRKFYKVNEGFNKDEDNNEDTKEKK